MEKSSSNKYGFQKDEIQPEDYVFGASLPMEVLAPNADWTEFLPEFEHQSAGAVETMACTIFGTLNAVEILLRRFGFDENLSDRWLAWNADVDPNSGGSPQRAAETLRKGGVPHEKDWPADFSSVENFYKTPPTKLIEVARNFLDRYVFKHEYVKDNSIESVKEALKYSPLGVSVTAWFEDNGVFYSPKGQPNNHWCVLYGFDDSKKAWKIFDSYDNITKLYSYDSEMTAIKRYFLVPRVHSPQKNWVIELCTSLWGFIRDIIH